MFNPYLAERLAEKRMKDAMRKAEQARLIRMVEGPRKVRGWWLPVMLIPSGLLGLVIRPQS